jgi:hypothetical protein
MDVCNDAPSVNKGFDQLLEQQVGGRRGIRITAVSGAYM